MAELCQKYFKSLHINRGCHGRTGCNGICPAFVFKYLAQTDSVAFAPTVIGSVFMRRFRLFLLTDFMFHVIKPGISFYHGQILKRLKLVQSLDKYCRVGWDDQSSLLINIVEQGGMILKTLQHHQCSDVMYIKQSTQNTF